MKVHIIEDEEILANDLANNIMSIKDDIVITGITHGVEDSINAIESTLELDLIFMDIRLENGDCFEILDSIHTNAFVVFTTGFDEFALKAFEYNCIDYILKPISLDSLRRVFEKYDNQLLCARIADARLLSDTIIDRSKIFRERIIIENDGEKVINVDDLCILKYDSGITMAYLSDGSKGFIFSSLAKIMEELNPSQFLRASRNYAISITSIDRIQSTLTRKKRLIMKSPWETESIETKNEIAKKIKLILSQHEIR